MSGSARKLLLSSRGSLCQKCCSILIKPAELSNSTAHKKWQGRHYYSDLEELKTSSQICLGCRILLSYLDMEGGEGFIDYLLRLEHTISPLSISVAYDRSAGLGSDPTKVATYSSIGRASIEVLYIDEEYSYFSVQFAFREAGEQMDHQSLPSIWGKNPPSTFSGSDALLSWLGTCDASHPECNRLVSRLPTRVIDVGPPDGSAAPRLLVSAQSCPIEARFIALSHCWGSVSGQLKTMKTSISAHQECLPMDRLPQTFRDAVTVTRFLGVRYLWIDSLCIVQDDKEDWSRESALMASIYTNAYLTIAATASEDSSGGLFRERKPPLEAEFQALGVSKVEDRADLDVHRFSFLNSPPFETLLSKSPLFKRGWTLQETILSRRMVHFTSSQLVWQCWSGLQSEDGSLHRARRDKSYLPVSISTPSEIRSSWRSWIIDYSKRKLSKAADKMATLTGLTKYIQAEKKDEPLLGLWKNDLVEDLLWRRWLGDEDEAKPRIDAFPTWTWMSLEVPIYHPPIQLTAKDIKLVETRITWIGEPLSSPLASGDLLLSAKLLCATICDGATRDDGFILRLNDADSTEIEAHGTFDTETSIFGQTISCILIGRSETYQRKCWYFLIASLINPEDNAYIRQGSAEIWYDEHYSPIADPFANVESHTFILR